MILKKRGVHPNRIADLCFFLSPDDPGNDLDWDEVELPPINKELVPVFMEGGNGWFSARPFCKLLSCKSYYNKNNYIDFEVVIEIPDMINVGWMEQDGDPSEVEGEGTPCQVNQGKILSKLNELLRSREHDS
jgi:hypothetical protein